MFIDRILFKYYDSNGDGYIDRKVKVNIRKEKFYLSVKDENLEIDYS